MTEALRLWLISLIGSVFLISAAEQLTPEGGPKKILRFASGLLLLTVLLRPLTGTADTEIKTRLHHFRSETERLREEYTAENNSRMETLIAEKTASYIETRAAELGLSVQAEAKIRWEGEIPGIEGIVLRGSRDAGFEKSIADALGIDVGKLRWEEGDE